MEAGNAVTPKNVGVPKPSDRCVLDDLADIKAGRTTVDEYRELRGLPPVGPTGGGDTVIQK